MVTKSEQSNMKTASIKNLLFTAMLGVGLLMITIFLFYVNPVLLVVQYKIRLENGSMLNEVLLSRFTSTKMSMYVFNVTNSERFLTGADEKIKLEEIGPFVYQEYRTNEDLEINKDPGIMRYTPKLEKVFVPEESVGDPKNMNVTAPNIALLAGTSLISKYPYLVRQLHNYVTVRNKMKPFVNIRVYDHIWGYADPLIEMANNVVPGVIYFKSVGLFERMYDVDVDYRLEIGTKNEDKFSVKNVTKIKARHKKTDARALIDNTFVYNDTYEGAAFPPRLTPDTPIHIYRHGLCKTFHLQYVASKRMSYGGDAYVYRLHNDTLADKTQCDSTGWCPEGLKDFSDCYFGFPVSLSKGHFLDADPRLQDMVEGLKPNRELHDSQVILDPVIGVGISGSMALQMSLFLSDVGFNPLTRRLKDIVLPVCNIIAKAPPLIEEVKSVLNLTYKQGPYIVLAGQVVCTLLGLLLLSHAVRMMYCIWLARLRAKRKDLKRTQRPLLS